MDASQLLANANVFRLLGLHASADPAEIAFAIKQAPTEPTDHVRLFTGGDLESLATSLQDVDGMFKMRLFAPWKADPLLAPWAARHDPLAETILWDFDVGVPGETAIAWLRLGDEPQLAEVLRKLAPPDRGYLEVWVDSVLDPVCAGISTNESPTPFLKWLQGAQPVRPMPVLAAVVTAACDGLVGVDERRAIALAYSVEASVAAEVAEAHYQRAAAIAGEVLVGLEGDFVTPVDADEIAELRGDLLKIVLNVAMNLSGDIARDNSYRPADSIVLTALEFPVSPDGRDLLVSQSSRIRAHWGISRFEAGVASNDLAGAFAGIEMAIEYAPTEEARNDAHFLSVELKEAARQARRTTR